MLHKDKFTLRQTMNTRNFEFRHNLDLTPPLVDFHQHDFYEIFFFLSGNVNYIIEGRNYPLRPGDILLTNNQDIHRPEIQPGRPYERYVIWMEPAFLDAIHSLGDDLTACFVDADQKKYKLIRPEGDVLTRLKAQCESIEKIKSNPAFGSVALQQANMIEFLVYLNRAYFDTTLSTGGDVLENDKINEVVSYINANLAEDLTLDHLAHVSYLSKFYLNNKFKQYTGLTLYQFIMKKRLTVARNMLREGQPVMEACMRCGFGDYSNFLKAFKREFGRNPREFMRQP